MKMNNIIKKIGVLSVAGLVLGLCAGAAFAQSNMIVNGSFESPGGGRYQFSRLGRHWAGGQ